jgi:hypothetical protein
MTTRSTSRDQLRRVGALWRPRPGAKSKGSGSLTIGTLRQRFVVMPNDRKRKDTDPDYLLLSADEPERDEYAARRETTAPTSATADALDQDVPF